MIGSAGRLGLLASLAGLVWGQNAITAAGTNFTLTADAASYLFHVDQETGDLSSDHFGGPVTDFVQPETFYQGGWQDGLANTRREFPDNGRSDSRLPAIHIKHPDGSTVSAFRYRSHQISDGKPSLPGLPATYGAAGDVSTLTVTLYDNVSDITAVLSYSVFPKYNAVARSFNITNHGNSSISIERAASFSLDLPNLDLCMLELQGDWSHENNRAIRKVDFGETTFRSTEGLSSHLHNPFFALMSPTTTETTGEAWGFNLIYSGSFAATAERFSHGFVRVLLGLNPLHASIPVAPGDTFTSPEAVAVYSANGIGGMSRSFHDLYRSHLSKSRFTREVRPILLNSWEGSGFDYNESSLVTLAGEAEQLGVELFVNDDGWFGVEYPRDNDTMGLGDWTPNPAKFPDGLRPYVNDVNNYTVLNSTSEMQFGLWVELDMVNPNSTLYHQHPDWAMAAPGYQRSLTRNQLALNLGIPAVQEFVLDTMHRILDSAHIQYIKWDYNRGIHEMPAPAADHKHILGMYRIIDNLTSSYPNVIWEGCGSGGGRFDAGLLYYWPQHWTSDDTDAAYRLRIQMGTSLMYPPSSMGCHVSAIPNGLTRRNISIEYRAHVAMMCGSFGFELSPSKLSAEEAAAIPSIMAEAHRVNPMVIGGDFYRLAWPDESNWPAVQFISNDTNTALVFAFQQLATVKPVPPPLRLQGLESTARYWNNLDNTTYSGATYMNHGLNFPWEANSLNADYLSKLVWLYKQ
ncbi:Alpha-galactosidase 2 [Lecanosticta acicola]|uniref:Alpha-galactosidase n=1 Tax=Lecanosticta acicola TaxID=111012 RepID=A0AAI8Z8H5_9PEZI|nr:Alpha-galactosidase 2 [Lecanosticta acicola]